MLVMSFDLSTTCTGVAIVRLENNSPTSVITRAIIPVDPVPTELGFLLSKKKFDKRGIKYSAFVKSMLENVSFTEKKCRDRTYRHLTSKRRLETILVEIDTLVKAYKPDLILYERNMIFGGKLTIEQLAKVAGTLLGIAQANGIRILEYDVNKVRASYDVISLVKSYVKGKSVRELRKVKDMTKVVLRELMCKKYAIKEHITTDESDALLIFDYWRRQSFDKPNKYTS